MKRTRFWLSIFAPFLWMALIFYFSSQVGPASNAHSNPLADLTGLAPWIIRKSAHFVLYFILGLLVYNFFHAIKRPSIFWSIVVCVLYAASDEIHQYFVPGRAALVSDVILDSVASIIAIIMLKYIYEKIASRRHHRPNQRRKVQSS